MTKSDNFDEIIYDEDANNGSLGDVVDAMTSKINIRLLIFIFILFIMIQTDIYNRYVLQKYMPSGLDGDVPNNRGVIATASIFAVLCGLFMIFV